MMSCKNRDKRVEKSKKVTHLLMHNRKIDKMSNLVIGHELKVIYLQNNCLKCIENLNSAINLTHLYLQHNNITKIENLQYLVNLLKLYLSYNRINVIEGLENLNHLVDLHVEYQQLSPGESLCFEPRTKKNLSRNLEYLNVSGNNLYQLTDFRGFSKLKTLIVKNNVIRDIKDVTETVSSLTNLMELSLQGNPVTRMCRYRETIIANSNQLKCFDGKPISDNSREFIKKFKREKQRRSDTKRSQTSLSDDITSSLNLPLSFRLSISRAIRDQNEPDLSVSFKTSSVELHPLNVSHWKTAPNNKSTEEKHNLPYSCPRNSVDTKQNLESNSIEQCAFAIPLLKK